MRVDESFTLRQMSYSYAERLRLRLQEVIAEKRVSLEKSAAHDLSEDMEKEERAMSDVACDTF